MQLWRDILGWTGDGCIAVAAAAAVLWCELLWSAGRDVVVYRSCCGSPLAVLCWLLLTGGATYVRHRRLRSSVLKSYQRITVYIGVNSYWTNNTRCWRHTRPLASSVCMCVVKHSAHLSMTIWYAPVHLHGVAIALTFVWHTLACRPSCPVTSQSVSEILCTVVCWWCRGL